MEILVRSKDADHNTDLFKKITKTITSAGVSHLTLNGYLPRTNLAWLQKKLGVLLKDTSSGPFIDEWKKVYAEISDKVEEVDVAQAISSAALAVKDENELVCPQIF